MVTVTHKPFKERIIHLLALKSYRKPELLLWMEQEGVSLRDKAELGGILEEVHGMFSFIFPFYYLGLYLFTEWLDTPYFFVFYIQEWLGLN